MAATVELCESNGATPDITHAIHNLIFGDTDSPNLFPSSDYDVAHGANSYEKWIRLHVTAMGGSTKVKNLRVWVTGRMIGSDALKTNARTSSYGGAASYATPTTSASTVATQDMPASEPNSANLGIGGSLSGEITAAGYSDYLVIQLQTDSASADTARDLVLHVAYDEE